MRTTEVRKERVGKVGVADVFMEREDMLRSRKGICGLDVLNTMLFPDHYPCNYMARSKFNLFLSEQQVVLLNKHKSSNVCKLAAFILS